MRANVELTAAHLRTCSPILSELAGKGELKIVGARYDLDTGLVEWPEEMAGRVEAPAAGHAVAHSAAPAASEARSHAAAQAAPHHR